MLTTIETTFGPDGLQAVIRVQADQPDTGVMRRVCVGLPTGPRAERVLSDAHLVLRAFGDSFGAVSPRIASHFQETNPDGSCPACKLLGRVLAAQGHRRLTDPEVARARIVVVPQGATALAEQRAKADREARAAAAERRKPRIGPSRGLTGADLAALADLF